MIMGERARRPSDKRLIFFIRSRLWGIEFLVVYRLLDKAESVDGNN